MAIYTKKDIKKTFSVRLPRLYTGNADIVSVDCSSGLSGDVLSDGVSVTGRTHIPDTRRVSSTVRAWSGSLIFGIGVISLGQAVTSIVYSLFPQQGEAVTDSMMGVLTGPGLWLWFVVAVMPAICEEALFRGYLMSAFRSRFKPWISILLVAVTFGIYHTSLVRFPATALLGGAFAYIVYKTGSIIPGAILHCINNSIAAAVILFPEWMEAHVPFLMTDVQETTVVLAEVGAGAVLILAGYMLMRHRGANCYGVD